MAVKFVSKTYSSIAWISMYFQKYMHVTNMCIIVRIFILVFTKYTYVRNICIYQKYMNVRYIYLSEIDPFEK